MLQQICTANAPRFVVISIVTFFSFLGTAQSADFFDAGTGSSYNLNAGDTLTITGGTYSGSINGPVNGATVTVQSGATFTPSSLNNAAGAIVVDVGGVAVLPTFSSGNGFSFDNSGTSTFSSLNFNGTGSITNQSDGVMNFNSSFLLRASNSAITNFGDMIFSDGFQSDQGTLFENNGDVFAADGFASGGTLINNDYIESGAFLDINVTSDVVNNCSLVSSTGFNSVTNNIINNGLIFDKGEDASSFVRFNGIFVNGESALVQGLRFENNATVNGGGSFWFAEQTQTQNNAFGDDNDGLDINFYDDTQTGSQFFDVQNATVGQVFRSFFEPLTVIEARTYCADLGLNGFGSLDFGDAPVSYGEASHTIIAGIHLGSVAPDEDDANQPTANADGDDNNGDADEGDISFPTLIQGATETMSVVVNQPSANDGYLQGWIDWNGDGDFEDANEQIATDLQLNSTSGTLSFDVTATSNAVVGDTYARFRWSTTLGLDETTAASDGEVEDDLVTIIAAAPELTLTKVADDDSDRVFGDIITYTYTVTNTGNVAIDDVSVSDVHNGAGFYNLNATPTGLSAITLSSITNTSSNSTDDGTDNDVDVLAVGDIATFTATYTVSQGDIAAEVAITNEATATGTPVGGTLVSLPVEESVTLVASPTSYSTPFVGINDYCQGADAFTHFQFDGDGEATADGIITAITSSSGRSAAALMDPYDNDDRYFEEEEHTTQNSNIGFNDINYINSDIVGANDIFTQTFSQGVHDIYIHLNSLDHLQFVFDPADNPNVGWSIVSSSDDGANIGAGDILSFADVINEDQDLDRTGERLGGDAGFSGDGTLRFFSIDGSPISQLVWRFQEDVERARNSRDTFQIAVEVCAVPDGSDAPSASYGYATHKIDEDVHLGGLIDLNGSDVSSALADGDDNNGLDDEDGIASLPVFTQGTMTSLSVDVNQAEANDAYLQAWVDWNGDGDFDDASEQIATNVQSSVADASTITLQVTTPLTATTTPTYARFRWSSTEDLNSLAAASDGEVEDYLITVVSANATVSGRVYIDANSNALEDPGESGIGGTVVVLRNTVLGTCQSVRTTGSGAYSIPGVVDGVYEIYQAHGETTPVPQNCDSSLANNPTGYQSTTADILNVTVSGSDISDQDFGEVAGATSTTGENTGTGITFEPDNQSEIVPGNVVFYPHVFTTEADGSVVFSTDTSGNVATGWAHLLYEDTDCSGTLNGSEGSASIAAGTIFPIDAGDPLCIINKVYAPSDVPALDRYNVETTATFSYTGSLGDITLAVNDLTIAASSEDASRLELIKTVQNVTTGTAEVQSLNQASPGDELIYRISYRNTGTGVITDLEVNDSVPAYTSYNGIITCDFAQTSLTTCTPTAPTNTDAISWTFGGTLNGGESGIVSYTVTVDQ